MKSDYDSPWKEILDHFFDSFVGFFFPRAHRQIDWDRGYEFLDKELQRIVADAAIGRRVVDKLVKVWLKTGAELWVLVHIEVQSGREDDFPLRLYIYNYRIFDRYKTRVATFVILADDELTWQPTHYRHELLGTTVSLRFSMRKLLNYARHWQALERRRDVFAIVVMAHLKVLETRSAPNDRLIWKLYLTKMLYERGYDELVVVRLFKFLDWLMLLPEELELAFMDDLLMYEEVKQMPYITSVERIGEKRGLETGRVEGSVAVVLRLLQRRFGPISTEIETRIRTLRFEQLEVLAEALLDFVTLADLAVWLDQ